MAGLRPSRSTSHPTKTVVATVAVVAILGTLVTVAAAFSSGSGAPASVSPEIADGGALASLTATLEPAASAETSATPGSTESAAQSTPSVTSSVRPPTTGPTRVPAPTATRAPTRPPTTGPTSTHPPATPPPTAAPTAAPTPPPASTVATILAAGDVRSNTEGIMATARLIEKMPGMVVLNVGDDSATGTAAEYADYFDPAWGRFKDRIFPTPGNHEYDTAGAAPYFAYYGARAGTPGRGWYSFDLIDTAWHVISLNGNVAHDAGSTQETWLRRDLAANAGKHIIAFWHQPRFSSGAEHGSDASYTAFWNDLEAAQAEIVLNGHDHDYERFALQDGAGRADPAGIREFVVGMGGTDERPFGGSFIANSQAHNDNCWGVLKLILRAHSYDWQFAPVAGCAYRDAGSQDTHS